MRYQLTQTGEQVQQRLNQVPTNTSDIADEVLRSTNKDNELEGEIDGIAAKIPSEATSSNQLADKAYVGTQVGEVQDDVDAINAKIPAAASAENQLTDKAYVDSSIATNTADFKGTFNSYEALVSGAQNPNANDYAFVISTDAAGNTVYNRYKYVTGTGWLFEYALNSSSFTTDQWAAIQSGITAALVTKLTDLPTATSLTTQLESISGSVTAEQTRAEGIEGGLRTDVNANAQSIANEKLRAEGVEGTLSTAINNEKLRAEGAEGTLQGNIDAEALTRGNADSALQGDIDAIEEKIPTQATASNQLADKAFVNSSISTATAEFKGTYSSLEELQTEVTDANANDYAFVTQTDADGNLVYNRYKYVEGTGWVFEYALNNSSFTAAQWAAIQSGITAALVTKLSGLPDNDALTAMLTAITDKIPAAASSSNKLVDYAQMVAALAAKQDTLTFDTTPTSGSSNPVTSGGIYTQIATLTTAITGLQTGKQNVLTFDDYPTSGSSNPAKSGGIFTRLAAKQDTLTFDTTPTNSSTNPVTSGGVAAVTSALNTRVSANEIDIDNLQAAYAGLTQSDIIVGALPGTGVVNTIYRVPGVSSYSDYMWNGSEFVLMATYDNATDNAPTKDSDNLVKSGGVFNNIGAFDISEYNATENPHTLATYADLTAALAALPADYQKGGMSIKFVQTSDNKYVQFRYMSSSTAAADFTNVANWQGVDGEPTSGSRNLVESGGVASVFNGYKIKYTNKYISTNLNLENETGVFVSDAISIKNGQTVFVHTENVTGVFCTLAKCNADATEFTQMLIRHLNGTTDYYYIATEDMYVCVCGKIGYTTLKVEDYDAVPTENSQKPVKSGGVYSSEVAIDKKITENNYLITDNAYKGYYISTNGAKTEDANYAYTLPIKLNAGETILVTISQGWSGGIGVISECDQSPTFPVDVKVIGVNAINNTIYSYHTEEDTYIIVSGIIDGFSYDIIKADEIKNLVKPEDIGFDTGWEGNGITIASQNDGTALCTFTSSNRVSRFYYNNVTFKNNHSYLFYFEVRSQRYQNAKILFNSEYSQTFDIYKGSGWTPVYFVKKRTGSGDLTFYVDDVEANEIGDTFEIKKPIIVDLTENIPSLNVPASNGGSYEVKYDNKYMTNANPITLGGETGMFVSEAIKVSSGDKLTIKFSQVSGIFTVLASCDSEANVSSMEAIATNSQQTSGTINYIAKDDGYVCICGAKDHTELTIETNANKEIGAKLVKMAYRWDDVSETLVYDVSGINKYVGDGDRLYSYVIAGSNSKFKDNADIVCTGENDQVMINRILELEDAKSVYFTDDSLFNLTAPIIPKSHQNLVTKGAKFLMCDCITSNITLKTNQYLTVDGDIDAYVKGMFLYVNDELQYNVVKEVFKNSNQIEIEINHVYNEGQFPYFIKTASAAIFIKDKEDILIDGMHIDLNVANNPFQAGANPWYLFEGIQIAYSDKVKVQNCEINNGGRRGICTTNVTNVWILNNIFNNWWEHSIDIFCSGSDYNPAMSYVVISGNVCLNNHMRGIQLHRGSGCTVTDNIIKNCIHGGIGTQEHAHHNTIVGNVIEGCGDGIIVGGHDTVVSGNTIKDSTSRGVNVYSSERITLTGNNFHNSGGPGVNLNYSSYCKVSNNTIVNSCLNLEDGEVADHLAGIISIMDSGLNKPSHHHVVSENHIIEETREAMPKYIYRTNGSLCYNNVFARNVSMIDGTIETPYLPQASDVVKDNELMDNQS